MMNVGVNRARNGVTDCPELRNEENFQSIELLDSSRLHEMLSYLQISNKKATRRTSDEFSSSKLKFEAARVDGSHPGTCLQVLIVVLAVELCQIR
ncbi:hypothetical protein E3N88_10047 [Mikania micrantha]|uniref:Uncharacterized protein n=1 Tax=Mikania micrantha TaxID=192012 RepID=A0A5N6PC70_9ASTR|nr:hypothetical protein E3N88_10047 [Mikania micrantha]